MKKHLTFDRNTLRPAIRKSICTGEKTAGFQNLETGRFTEDRLIRSDRDLADFCRDWSISREEIADLY